ncbi:hypothetical protein MCOR02_007988 [Pyricularia oryzae]|uniref:Uncharacterized protein n=1 Tax=Pyricularia oryzae TaxID=318829 RepID=A0A4P7NI19_PYROR|nr:hypothetical protein MCOR01_004017 [Pyricularia oryzae]KAH9430652.1 hypothetical protein MCOR02_007988 [Pyricularia oryzae]KAI6251844.1 hypothetical protein MCOR19_011524 [Pyricularia oryzae]KAI6446301.1 hypothetical protein MCOR17_010790 [Pyricularia oryzae]KAI6582286.1 hypothetical protein MCOR06_008636 [Pyricularia oryzae]
MDTTPSPQEAALQVTAHNDSIQGHQRQMVSSPMDDSEMPRSGRRIRNGHYNRIRKSCGGQVPGEGMRGGAMQTIEFDTRRGVAT